MDDNNDDQKPGEETTGSASERSGADQDLRAALDEAAKWKNDYLYLRADFDNYRKNVLKDRADLIKYGCERLVAELLGFLDTMERALEMSITPENIVQFKTGIEMTSNELKSVLSRFGVQECKAEGEPFNPSEHEALTNEETDLVAPGHVLRVYRKAYKLHDRLIRPAQVVVAKAITPKEG